MRNLYSRRTAPSGGKRNNVTSRSHCWRSIYGEPSTWSRKTQEVSITFLLSSLPSRGTLELFFVASQQRLEYSLSIFGVFFSVRFISLEYISCPQRGTPMRDVKDFKQYSFADFRQSQITMGNMLLWKEGENYFPHCRPFEQVIFQYHIKGLNMVR